MKKRMIFIIIFLVMIVALAVYFSKNASINKDTDSVSSNAKLNKSDIFTSRELKSTADLTNAVKYVVEDGKDINITKEGVYVLSGSANNMTIYVEATSEEKVQLVFDNLNITNENFPCIYVKECDKVFVTTTSDSSLTVTDDYIKKEDGVIYSKSDIVFNGNSKLVINSSENGIVGKDDVKITSGTYDITASSKCIDANDSICIADGTLNLNANMDALHAENSDDDSLGYIYICGGNINIQSEDDGIHGTSIVQIDGGNIDIKTAEGIEGSYIQINGGTINIKASADGINAANKSSSYSPTFEMNDGTLIIVTGDGDTDAIDSNGDVYINGGTIDITAPNSAFDFLGNVEFNAGTVIINGTKVDTIPNTAQTE